jgi:hypothetical protein
MILFFSDGRLGNQLFQYSFLNSLSKKNERIVCFNMKNFSENFIINNKKFTSIKLSRVQIFFYKKLFIRLFDFFSLIKIVNVVSQSREGRKSLPEYSFVKGILPITYVKTGFFQSELMFDPGKVDFSLKENDLKVALSILSGLGEHEFVFVHVRRGDYLNETYEGIRGIDLPRDYFTKAMNEISSTVKRPFYIFVTDDYGYVECCFSDVKCKFISKESMSIDLALMSLCQNGIASNSSFSWWGAYLMLDRKEVIFPRYWYGWKIKKESHPCIQPSWGKILDFTA